MKEQQAEVFVYHGLPEKQKAESAEKQKEAKRWPKQLLDGQFDTKKLKAMKAEQRKIWMEKAHEEIDEKLAAQDAETVIQGIVFKKGEKVSVPADHKAMKKFKGMADLGVLEALGAAPMPGSEPDPGPDPDPDPDPDQSEGQTADTSTDPDPDPDQGPDAPQKKRGPGRPKKAKEE